MLADEVQVGCRLSSAARRQVGFRTGAGFTGHAGRQPARVASGPSRPRLAAVLAEPWAMRAELLPDLTACTNRSSWRHAVWKAGSKDACPGIRLITSGFAVASINYRLSQEVPFPAQIEDCRAAIRFLRANAAKYNLDANHIGVWGGSAGGHLVALLGTTGGRAQSTASLSDKVQCVVDWYGPTDLTPDGPAHGRNLDVITQLLGGPVQEKLELATQASPLKQVTANAAPFLIMHGDADHTVNIEHSKLLHAALQKAGVETTLKILPGAGHGGAQFNSDENRKSIEEFFRRHLVPIAPTT